METLSKDLKYKVLNLLNDEDLESMCKTNIDYRNVCKDETFWRIRLEQRHPEQTVDDGKYRDFYKKKYLQKKNLPDLDKDVKFKTLNLLSDKDLASLCQTNTHFANICNDERFWRLRIVEKYGKEALMGEKNGKYKDFYTSGKVRAYLMCKMIENIPHASQLVVDDFYNPDTGFVNNDFTVDRDLLTFLLLKIVKKRMIKEGQDTTEIDKLIKERYDLFPDFRERIYISENESDKERFREIIDVNVGRPEILRNMAKRNPNVVKALSPEPERKFLLISHIHYGFRHGNIPFDILWSELCDHPYIQSFYVQH